MSTRLKPSNRPVSWPEGTAQRRRIARVLDLARVQNDQLRALAANRTADKEVQHRLFLGRIDAGQDNDVRLFNRGYWIGPRVSQHCRAALVVDIVRPTRLRISFCNR